MILIKSKKEIDFIRESCRIVAETLQLLKSTVKPGITTLELIRLLKIILEAIMQFRHSKVILKVEHRVFPAQFVLLLMMKLFTEFQVPEYLKMVK